MFFVHRSRGHDGTCVWRSWQRCFPANLVKFIQGWKPNFNFIFQSFQGFSRVILWIFMGLCHENCRIFQDILTKLGFPRNLHQKILNWWQKKIPSAWDIHHYIQQHIWVVTFLEGGDVAALKIPQPVSWTSKSLQNSNWILFALYLVLL